MQLKCPVCGETADMNKNINDGFQELAYTGFIEWSDFDDHVPDLDEENWIRSEILPQAGDTRIIKVKYPFNFKIGEEFNLLFKPALSALNGWDAFPQEISKSAIVSCKLITEITSTAYKAWVKIEILKVNKLEQLHKIYSAHYTNQSIEDFEAFKTDYYFKYENWQYYCWSAQGDCGEWKLIYTDNAGINHLVLLGKWGFHEDNIHCGNLIRY